MTEHDLFVEDLENDRFVGILELPDEILLKIFSHLSSLEILVTISCVCKHFNRLAKDPSLLESITLKPNVDEANQEHIINVLTRSRCLKRLTLKGRRDAECLVSTATIACPKLEVLEIIQCPQLSDDCLATIAESDMRKSLRCLNLDCTQLSTHWGISQITKLHGLTKLNLFNCRFFDSGDLKVVAYNCENLEHLNLEEVTHLSEESVITLITERKSSLKCLYLDGESLSDKSLKHLFLCQKLQELGISFAEEIGELGIAAISQLSKLTILKLKRAKKVPADDFITLFANKTLPVLRHLDLSECVQVNDEVVQTLALGCPLLETVMLNWCWEIRDAGLEFLVRYCNEIIKLCLVGVVLLTDEFMLEIHDHLPKLSFLDLQQCPNITDTRLEGVVRKSDHFMEIVNYYGEIIQYSECGANDVESSSDRESSTTEEALKTGEISDDLSGAF